MLDSGAKKETFLNELKTIERTINFIEDPLLRDAIADAIMKTYHKLMFDHSFRSPKPEFFNEYSYGKCGVASLIFMYELLTTARDCLKKIFIVMSRDMTEDKGLVGSLEWGNHHALCIFQDNTGSWFACSPANYERNLIDSRSNIIIFANSAKEIIEKIQLLYGRSWPDLSELDSKYLPPTLDQEFKKEEGVELHSNILKCTVVQMNKGNTTYHQFVSVPYVERKHGEGAAAIHLASNIFRHPLLD